MFSVNILLALHVLRSSPGSYGDLTLGPSFQGEGKFSPWMHHNCNFFHFFFLGLNVTPGLDTAEAYIDISHARCVPCIPTPPMRRTGDLHKWWFVRLVFSLSDSRRQSPPPRPPWRDEDTGLLIMQKWLFIAC